MGWVGSGCFTFLQVVMETSSHTNSAWAWDYCERGLEPYPQKGVQPHLLPQSQQGQAMCFSLWNRRKRVRPSPVWLQSQEAEGKPQSLAAVFPVLSQGSSPPDHHRTQAPVRWARLPPKRLHWKERKWSSGEKFNMSDATG